MIDELGDLYQQLILDHNRSPRNRGRLEDASRHAEGFNPLCGDRISLDLKLDGDVVAEARFEGAGCAISVSSASMMTEAIKGRPVEEVEEEFRRFHDLVTGEGDAEGTGKLRVFAGVREFPDRVKCAILGWHAMRSALTQDGAAVTTE